MPQQTVLYLADTDTPDSDLAQLAAEAARRDSRVHCFLFQQMPTLPINAYGGLPYAGISAPEMYPEQLKSAQAAVKARADDVENILRHAGCAGVVRPVLSATADICANVVTSARVADVACIAPNLRDEDLTFRECLNAVLFHSPIGVVLNGTPLGTPQTVFLAWNDSAAAARAAHLALPLLKSATEVVIGCFDPQVAGADAAYEPGADLAAWLAHHGCNTRLTPYPSGGVEIGAAICARATEAGAEMIVMGAYGHSRMRQAVFGGTTRSLVEQTKIPVFLAH